MYDFVFAVSLGGCQTHFGKVSMRMRSKQHLMARNFSVCILWQQTTTIKNGKQCVKAFVR